MQDLRDKISDRLDLLQKWMESNYHLECPELVYDHTLTISKFWSVLSEEDREYVQAAQDAIPDKKSWQF